VQSLQALRVEVKFFDCGSASSIVAADVRRLSLIADLKAGASLQLPQDSAVGEHAAQLMSSFVLRMCEF
jgi:hypothetical protein